MAGCLAGQGSPAVTRPLVAVFAGNHGVVGAGRIGLSGGGDRADGREFRGRRRSDQPDLRRLRLGLKVFDLALDIRQRHHAGPGA